MSTDVRISRIGIVPLIGVAVIGAIIGTAWDLLHVRLGATEYSIGPERQPFWVPLEFGLVYTTGVVAISKIGRAAPARDSLPGLAREAMWVSVIYATTAIAHTLEWVVVGLLAAALIARRRSLAGVARANHIAAAGLVVLGPAVEAVLIAAGLFRYTNASLGNVPVWLPLLYASAIPFAVRLTESALLLSRRAAHAIS